MIRYATANLEKPTFAGGLFLFVRENMKLLMVVLLALSSSAHADFSGLVVRVSDGDTIKVRDRCGNLRTVRMLGIDAPEKKQTHGLESKSALTTMVSGKRVKIITSKRDKYGRDLGKVIYAKQDINLEQIKSGNAWHYKAYQGGQSEKDRIAYSEAENAARANLAGLWGGDEKMPPWEFRDAKM